MLIRESACVQDTHTCWREFPERRADADVASVVLRYTINSIRNEWHEFASRTLSGYIIYLTRFASSDQAAGTHFSFKS